MNLFHLGGYGGFCDAVFLLGHMVWKIHIGFTVRAAKQAKLLEFEHVFGG